MRKLLSWLITLAVIIGLFWKADTILEAVGQPELAKQAAELRDGLLTRFVGKDTKAVEEKLAKETNQLRAEARKMTDALARFSDSMGFDPDELAGRAVNTFKSAAGMVPEEFAAYYEALKAQGEKHVMNVTDFALTFSDHYSDEIAPELAGYWNEQIASGKLAKDKLELTKQALAKVRVKMRPLLTDYLRVLARLEQKLERTTDAQEKQEIQKDMKEIEQDIQRSFEGVPADETVLDTQKKASERLARHLESTDQPKKKADPKPTTEIARAMAPPSAPDAPPAAADKTKGKPSTAADKTKGKPAAPAVAAKASTVNENKLRKGVKPWLGTKYRMGTNARGKTTDCSGFVGGVMDETFKLELPRTSRLQYKFGDKVKRKELLPGDLVFFDMKKRKRIDHVGVYVGKDDKGVHQFAHASFSRGVRYDSMVGYYADYYWGAARVLGY